MTGGGATRVIASGDLDVETALDVARRSRAVLGARGVDLDAHVMRHILNLEASYSYGGTHDIHGLVMGRALTGIPAF